MRQRALGTACTIALLVCSCSTLKPKDQLKLREVQLQRAKIIEASILDLELGSTTYRTFLVGDPAVLEKVRAWIREHAWPPIDFNSIGQVAPRGYFTVFEGPSEESSAFRIYVWGKTGRTTPHIFHVSDEDWQKLLALLPNRR